MEEGEETDTVRLFHFSAPPCFQGPGPLTFCVGKLELQLLNPQFHDIAKALLASPNLAAILGTAPHACLSTSSAELVKLGEAHGRTGVRCRELFLLGDLGRRGPIRLVP